MKHGNYTSRLVNSYLITKEIYNYLLPIYGICVENKTSFAHIQESGDKYFFMEVKTTTRKCY